MQTVTGEDIDATDSFKLLRRLTLPKTWQQDDDAEPLDTGDVRRAKVPPAPLLLPLSPLLMHCSNVPCLFASAVILATACTDISEWLLPPCIFDGLGLAQACKCMCDECRALNHRNIQQGSALRVCWSHRGGGEMAV